MNHIKSILLASTMLLAMPLFFSSCREDAPELYYEMSVSVNNDFTKVVEAINNGSKKNEEAINKLTSAIDKLTGEQSARLQLIINVLNDVNATLDAKLAVIEAAMKSQTLSLESKFDLLHKAIGDNTLKLGEFTKNLTTAIDAVNDTLGKKLSAIESIIKSTSATTAEKLAAIDATMAAQTVSLKEKFDLLVTAVDNNTLETNDLSEKLAGAIDALNVTVGKKLVDIEAIIKDSSVTTAEKLEAISGVIKAHTLSFETKMDLLKTAIENLPNYDAKLKAILDAIKPLSDYTEKITAIATAIEKLPNYGEKFDAVVVALDNIKVQITNIGAGRTDMTAQITAVATAINDLIKEVNKGNISESAGLEKIIEALEALNDPITPNSFVDLGLPSGLKWATRNLGAKNPEDFGKYYPWGETESRWPHQFTWERYAWSKDTQNSITKYCKNAAEGDGGFVDNKLILEAEDDAATKNFGKPWRMPTKEEYQELLRNCKWTWETINGNKVYKGVSKINGNLIILPVAGYMRTEEGGLIKVNEVGIYWTSSLCNNVPAAYDKSYFAFSLNLMPLKEAKFTGVSLYHRYIGAQVRAVR